MTIRIGVICPSSNTALEPAASRLMAGLGSLHVTRVGVTRIGLDQGSDDQFDIAAMESAARLLADARVGVVAWAGTSGGWLGLDRERRLAARLSAAGGAPATTSTLALLEACRAYGVKRLGVVSPYTADVCGRIAETLGRTGIDVANQQYASMSTNFEFATLGTARVESMIRTASSGVDAVAVMCTNVDGIDAARAHESCTSTTVFDSIAATMWHAAMLAGALPVIQGIGDLGIHGHLRAGMQNTVDRLRVDTGADRTTLRIDLPGGGCSVDTCAAESCAPGVRSIRRDATLPQRDLDTVQWIEAHRSPLVQANFTAAPRPPRALLEVYGVRAQMLAPVVSHKAMAGWLSVHSLRERDWSEQHRRALTTAAREIENLLPAHPVSAVI